MDFEDSGFTEFDVEIEEVDVKKTAKFNRMWSFQEGGGSSINEPLVRGNAAFFGACDGYVYAVDIPSGKEIWRTKLGGLIAYSSPQILGEDIFIGSYDGFLYCLDMHSGLVTWKSRTGGRISSSPAATKDGIFVGTEDRNLYCFDHSGRECWCFVA